MAYSEDMWQTAKALYELNASYNEIVKRTGISKGQISKKAAKENWRKETPLSEAKADIIAFEKEKGNLERKKETIVSKLADLKQYEIVLLDDVLTNIDDIKTLLLSASTLAVARSNAQLTKNKKTTIVKVKQYNDNGQVCGETIEMAELELQPEDIKTHIEAIDKASLTLGINQRHAPKVEVQNTNATQNNFTPHEISKAIADGLPD